MSAIQKTRLWEEIITEVTNTPFSVFGTKVLSFEGWDWLSPDFETKALKTISVGYAMNQGLAEYMSLIDTRSWKALTWNLLTLCFSGLKDGDEAESLKLSNLDDSGDSEEDNVQPEIVDDYKEYSSKEGKQHFRGSKRRVY